MLPANLQHSHQPEVPIAEGRRLGDRRPSAIGNGREQKE
jgi:hypothetical protein